MEKYRGVDYLELERLLSEDAKLVRDLRRDFAEREIEPIIIGKSPLPSWLKSG